MEDLNEKLCKMMLLVSAIIVGVALLWAGFSDIVSASSYPTAGITKYLGELVADSLQKADTEEHKVNVVSDYEFVDDTNPDITTSDVELLASLIYYEQGEPETAEDEERCYLTGCVVLNRVASDEFPNTMAEVINQQGQYACANKVRNYGYYGDICFEIAEGLLTYGVEDVPDNLVFQAQFPQGSGTYKKIYNQYFCYR